MSKLPKDVLTQRIKNEINQCGKELEHDVIIVNTAFDKFPVQINVTLKNAPGPFINDGKLTTRFFHKIEIFIDENYPYKKPEVRWRSPIFHPNICTPEDGGFVCSKLLDNWSFSSDLASFIRGLETLLVEPNPKSPYKTISCVNAAKYFTSHPYKPPMVIKKDSKSTIRIIKKEEDCNG